LFLGGHLEGKVCFGGVTLEPKPPARNPNRQPSDVADSIEVAPAGRGARNLGETAKFGSAAQPRISYWPPMLLRLEGDDENPARWHLVSCVHDIMDRGVIPHGCLFP
jgi:hypothetical protein